MEKRGNTACMEIWGNMGVLIVSWPGEISAIVSP